MKTVIILIALVCSGCANPAGSSWWVTDFNKYDKNYFPFPTDKLIIGLPKDELSSLMGSEYSVVEGGERYEVIACQRWRSVPGRDYVVQTLYIRLVDGRIKNWKVTNDTVLIVPRTW